MKQSLHRIPLILLVFTLIRPSALFATANTVSEIKGILNAQAAAWNRGDIDGYMNGYARDRKTEFAGGDTLTRGLRR